MELPTLSPDYKPDASEEYMNPMQLAYFRQKLNDHKSELMGMTHETLEDMKNQGGVSSPELTDRATAETDWALELRTRDRARKFFNKIEAALRRIEEGEYGYCEETGEPIGLKRLEARPEAALSLAAQELHERSEKLHRDERTQ